MIRHIVAFELVAHDEAERGEDARTIKRELESLVGLVPQIQELHVGVELGLVKGHWDAVLVSDFASADDLASYQEHPEHVRAAKAISPLIAARAVVDYELA
ncbi:Dabb family protein [Saccharopolyspora phatthalungensis]|uniref:Stress-response A/B barrel domain-containing protein n=1 Tax=Saccharopolyspora phatthalungensis TaxID=664693 RepID=A0A840Q8U6_9PSEU|nr:Dabb family protein [Saccharopolyspora phatthalungensis]MBB5157174.1 hypothetical protein [Saccharopolyspora phatthalungensis]